MTVVAVFARRSAGLAVSRTTRSIASTQTYNGLLRSSRTTISNGLPSLVRFYADKFPSHSIISMPALSPTMTAGNIGTWQKKAGDTVAPGDVLVEIETDKAQMDFEFQEDGVLAKILLESGEKDVAVGSPIAVMVEDGADVEAFKEFTVEDAGGKKEAKPEEPKEDKASAEPSAVETDKRQKSEETESKSKPEETKEVPQTEESTSGGGKLQTSLERLDGSEFMASPAAKVLALKNGVPLKDIKGSGTGGRITKADVEKYGAGAGSAASGKGGPVSPPVASSGPATYEDIPISGMRKSIGTRLQQSKVTAPHYYVSSRVSVSKLMKLRQALNTAGNGEYKISVNDIFVRALGVALLKHPKVNSAWLEKEGVIRQYSVVDVSVAVATPSGLITPIVKSAHAKGLATISQEIKGLAVKARDGKLKPEEYQGGTFTISNMGMNDAVSEFTAIINPPQSGILAVGSVKKVAIEGPNGEVIFDEQITMTGSFDHRTVDGAVGGDFMKTLRKILENPLEMML